jgi:hypothetical protein
MHLYTYRMAIAYWQHAHGMIACSSMARAPRCSRVRGSPPNPPVGVGVFMVCLLHGSSLAPPGFSWGFCLPKAIPAWLPLAFLVPSSFPGFSSLPLALPGSPGSSLLPLAPSGSPWLLLAPPGLSWPAPPLSGSAWLLNRRPPQPTPPYEASL